MLIFFDLAPKVFDGGSDFIYGTGVDLVYIPRFYNLLASREDKFLNRAFHKLEIEEYSKKDGEVKTRFLASRWAVKEALYKAFGGTWRMPFPEVYLKKDAHGK